MKTTDNIKDWQSSPFELEPDKFWTDDDTNELVCAATGERFTVSSLLAQRDAALAALRGLFEHCSMIHNKWGEGCNQKQADAAIQQARAALAATQGS